MPWDDSVKATAVASGSYEELLMYTMVPLLALYKTFYIMKTWAEWPIALIDFWTMGFLNPLISYFSGWTAKLFELMVVYPAAWLRH